MIVNKVSIKDVCKFVGGSQPPKDVFSSKLKDGYIRLIQTRDFKTSDFLTYIPISLAKKRCDKDEVMIGRYGPPIFQVFRGLEGAYNVALMKAVPKSNILNDYLYYLLKQKEILTYVESLSLRTGGQTGVDLDSLNEYPVLLPDIPYQQKVAGVLKDLDEKIKINRQINSDLESIVKTLFDYWFVQFDFPDKNYNPYKSYKGEMTWNTKLNRQIPAGWTNGNLLDVGEVIGGSTPSRAHSEYFTKSGMSWITPKDLSMNNGNKFITHGEIDVSDLGLKSASLKVMPKGTVLLSSRAPIGYMAISRDLVTTNQGFKSLIPKSGFSTPFVFYTVKNAIPDIINNSCGSTFKEISGSTLKTIEVCLPPKILIEQFTKIAEPIFEKQSSVELENQKLSALRDWLLPMLMNGQVKIEVN
jgi:type I restriction enzyme S subunit